jgi:hypothetical protein
MMMYFNEEHLHEAMKLSLDALCKIITESNDVGVRGDAAVNLANIILEIYDRQNEELPAFDFLDEEEDLDEEQ